MSQSLLPASAVPPSTIVAGSVGAITALVGAGWLKVSLLVATPPRAISYGDADVVAGVVPS